MTPRLRASAMPLGMFAVSAALHVLAFVALQFLPSPRPARFPVELESIELQQQPPGSERSQQADAPLAAPAAPRPPRRVAPPRRAPAAAAPVVTAPVEPTPSDTGVTAPDPAPPAAAAVGSPAGAAPASPPGVDGRQATGAGPAETGGALGRGPGSPAGLDALLRRHYPRLARMQGVEGRVLVRIRIGADGRVGAIRVMREEPRGFDFAAACRDMLQHAPAFRPGLDRQGHPLATDVSFTCTFEVDD